MIFDRLNGDKEVWRRSSDISEHVVDESSTPDAIQLELYGPDSHFPTMDGLFRPWAVLHMPERTSAFRFVYPTLIVAAYNRAYLWDVPSGKLIQTLQECQFISFEDGYNQYLHRIMYVEISERHVFLTGQTYLRIFSRASGKSVLDLSSFEKRYGLWNYRPATSHFRTPGSALMTYETTATREPVLPREGRSLHENFVSGASTSLGSFENELNHDESACLRVRTSLCSSP
jgi:hypothetical protein